MDAATHGNMLTHAGKLIAFLAIAIIVMLSINLAVLSRLPPDERFVPDQVISSLLIAFTSAVVIALVARDTCSPSNAVCRVMKAALGGSGPWWHPLPVWRMLDGAV